MHALIFGATGLVGGHLLTGLAHDDRCVRLTTLGRRPMAIVSDTHMHHVVDFDRLEAAAEWFAVDAVFCALGTTIRQAGSKAAFRRVDHDYPVEAGRLARARGAAQYLLVSSLGANAASRLFYPRVKGQVEASLADVGFESLSIFRPSQLAGDRAERRPMEGVAQAVLKAATPLLVGPLRRYRLSPAETVAQAMIAVAFAPAPGTSVYEAEVLPDLAQHARSDRPGRPSRQGSGLQPE